MKFLSRKYRESMEKWFRKSGHGMHVMCVVFRNNDNKLAKKTFTVFIGKVAQDVRAVITIYEKCLEQIKVDIPLIEFLVDKWTIQDAITICLAKILFSWKAQWPPKNVGIQFVETIFNERQADRDQYDRDSATAKRQINYYIEKGNSIESAVEMNGALQTAMTLCGFNSMVLEIQEKKQ